MVKQRQYITPMLNLVVLEKDVVMASNKFDLVGYDDTPFE